MHTNEISRVIALATNRVIDGEATPETAKAVSELARTEISNWRARLEYARHTGKIASISELEPEKASSLRKAA
jgi:hypothetical protein